MAVFAHINIYSYICGMKWKKIEGFEWYMISDCGDVMSVRRKARGSKYRMIEKKILKRHKNAQGVVYVKLTDENGKQVSRTVWRLMAHAFLEKGKTYYFTGCISNLVDGFKDDETIKYSIRSGHDISKYKKIKL